MNTLVGKIEFSVVESGAPNEDSNPVSITEQFGISMFKKIRSMYTSEAIYWRR